MKSNGQKTTKGTTQDTVCGSFMKKHTDVPSALFGGYMEKEAYLDSLFPRVSYVRVPVKTALSG